MSDTTATPAGWYPDPHGGPTARWWDGAQWTDHHAPLQQRPEDLKAPEGTKTNTPWIWLIVFLPLLSYVSLFALDWNAYVQSSISGSFSGIISPGYVVIMLSSWVLYALLVVFAALDYRALKSRGVPQPFHWAWGFLNPVYPIGRAVVVRRRTGSGIWPMWGAIAVLAAGLIISIVFMIYLMQIVFAYIPIAGTVT